MIIAVDFDGTLCANKFPEIGEPNVILMDWLKEKQASGDKLILWTCREDERLAEAVEWCGGHGLIFDAVNENLQSSIEWANGSDSRKVYANLYIDDKCVSMYYLMTREIKEKRDKASENYHHQMRDLNIMEGRVYEMWNEEKGFNPNIKIEKESKEAAGDGQ